MKFKVGCAMAVLAVMFFDTARGGALKKHFSNGEQSTSLEVGEKSAPSEDGGVAANDSAESSKEDASKAAAIATQPEENASSSSEKKKIVGDPVVLRINGKKEYRRSHILADMKMIPPQMIQGVSPDKLFEMLRDQRLKAYLMIEQAKKAGMDRTKEFFDRVEQLKEELLGRMFLMKELAPKTENESALKARYTKYLVEFKKGKEFKIYHIMTSTEAEIKEVLAALGKGEDFSKLAKQKSMAPSKEKDGEEGYIPVDIMPSQIKDKVILLKVGEYTKDFVKTENGFHVFKVGDIRDTTPQKYEEAVPMLKQLVLHEEMTKMLDRLEKQAKVERFNEDGTPAAAPKEKKSEAPAV
ncbi:MAG: peptidyl-prolyl cis-trans isomerase [Holosporaceae bacterium]|nr:peptidyl-prolyl cis-trans isomerase [Holosporaceae bacterium]